MAHQPDDPQKTEPLASAARKGAAVRRILIMTANKADDLECFYPYYRLSEAGYQVDIATPKGGKLTCKNGVELQETMELADIRETDYDAVYIPGGDAPLTLRKNKDALELAQAFVKSGKPVAAICHGPLVLAAADVIKNRRIAAWPETVEEIEEAGATWINQKCVVDDQFITARWPGDLPAHLAQFLETLQASAQSKRTKVA